MKYTDEMFSFPVRLYAGKDYRKYIINQEKSIEDDKMSHSYKEEVPEYIISTAYIYHSDIVGISPSTAFHDTIESLSREGSKLTEVDTKNRTYLAAMKIEDFIDRLNEFFETQQARIEEERQKIYQQKVQEVTKLIEKSVEALNIQQVEQVQSPEPEQQLVQITAQEIAESIVRNTP